jgi:uncharacterized protein
LSLVLGGIGYLAAVFMGIVLGALGAGGAILTVPILISFFGFNGVEASQYSLGIVGLCALVASREYFKQGLVRIWIAIAFAFPGIFGVMIGRGPLLKSIPLEFRDVTVLIAFSVVMLGAGVSMLMSPADPKSPNIASEPNRFLTLLIGFFVGILTGFTGAGGGFVIVPVLTQVLNLEMRVAIGTSLVVITINSLIGFVSSIDEFKLGFYLSYCAFALVGIRVGVKIQKLLPVATLKKTFGELVILVGVVLFVMNVRGFF